MFSAFLIVLIYIADASKNAQPDIKKDHITVESKNHTTLYNSHPPRAFTASKHYTMDYS